MGLEPKLQTELYNTYWRPMEKAFGQAAYVVHFDAFMRHYLTTKTGEIPNVREVYLAFKAFAQKATRHPHTHTRPGGRHPRLRPVLLRHGLGHRDRCGLEASLMTCGIESGSAHSSC